MFTTATQIVLDCVFDEKREIECSAGGWNIPICYNREDLEKLTIELQCSIEFPQYIFAEKNTFQKLSYSFDAYKKDGRIYLGTLDTAQYSKIVFALRPDFTNCLIHWDEHAINELKGQKKDPLISYVSKGQVDSCFNLVTAAEAERASDKHTCYILSIKGGTVSDVTMVGRGGVLNEGGVLKDVKVYRGKLEITSGGTAYGINENGGEVIYDDTCEVDFARNFVTGAIINEGHFTIHHRTTFDHCEILTSGEVFSGGLITDTHIGSNGRVTLNTNATMRDVVITNGGYVDASADRCATRHVLVSSGGEMTLGNHTRLSGITICSGGCVYMPSFMKEKYMQHITVEDGGRVSEVLDAKPDEKEQAKKDLKDEVEKSTQEALADKNLKKKPIKPKDHILLLKGKSDNGIKEWVDEDGDFWCTVRCNISAIYLTLVGSDYLLAYERAVVRYSPSTHVTYITLGGLHLYNLATNEEADLGILQYCDYVYSIEFRDQKNPIYDIDTIELDAKKLHYRKDLGMYHAPYTEKIKAKDEKIYVDFPNRMKEIDPTLIIKGKSNYDFPWFLKLKWKSKDGKEFTIKSANRHREYNKETHEVTYDLYDWYIEGVNTCDYSHDEIMNGKITDIWVQEDVPEDFALDIDSIWYKGKKVQGPPYLTYHIVGEKRYVNVFDPNRERKKDEKAKTCTKEYKDPDWKKFASRTLQVKCDVAIRVDSPLEHVQVRKITADELDPNKDFESKFHDPYIKSKPVNFCSTLEVKGSTTSDVSIFSGGHVKVTNAGYIDDARVYPGGVLHITQNTPYGHVFEFGGFIDFDGDETNTVNGSVTKNLKLNKNLSSCHKGTAYLNVTMENGSKLHIRGRVAHLTTKKVKIECDHIDWNEVNVYNDGRLSNFSIYSGGELTIFKGAHVKHGVIYEHGSLTVYDIEHVENIIVRKGATIQIDKSAFPELSDKMKIWKKIKVENPDDIVWFDSNEIFQ